MTGSIKPLFSWRSALMGSNLSGMTKYVALALSLYMSERGDSAFPGATRLARDMSMTDRFVRNHLAALVDKGWLTVKEGGGRGRANSYEASIPCSIFRESSGEDEETLNLTPVNPEPDDTQTLNVVPPNTTVNTPVNTPTTLSDPRFERFYEAYPRKKAKGAALKAWNRMIQKEDPETIIEGARVFAASVRGKDPKYVPYPGTWLHSLGWLDEPDPQGVPERYAALERFAQS